MKKDVKVSNRRYRTAKEDISDIRDVAFGFLQRAKACDNSIIKLVKEIMENYDEKEDNLPYDILVSLGQMCRYLSLYDTFSKEKKKGVDIVLENILKAVSNPMSKTGACKKP